MTVFSTLVITFILLAAGNWNANCEKAAGYIGFFCGASAIYAAFAYLYKDEVCEQSHPLPDPCPCNIHPPPT